jgi:hypothetical protein
MKIIVAQRLEGLESIRWGKRRSERRRGRRRIFGGHCSGDERIEIRFFRMVQTKMGLMGRRARAGRSDNWGLRDGVGVDEYCE